MFLLFNNFTALEINAKRGLESEFLGQPRKTALGLECQSVAQAVPSDSPLWCPDF